MAVQRACARRDRPALRRRGVPDGHRGMRDVRPRSAHGRRLQRARAPGNGGPRPGLPEGLSIRAGRRGARRGVSAAVHDGSHRLPLPHSNQDRANKAAARRRPRRMDGDRPSGRRAARHRRGRRGPRRVPPRRHRGPSSSEPCAARASCSPRSITEHGTSTASTRRPAPPGQRADPDRVGSRVQATDVQDRLLPRQRVATGCRRPPPPRRRPRPSRTAVPATSAGPGSNAAGRVEPTPRYQQDPALGTSTAATHDTLVGGR